MDRAPIVVNTDSEGRGKGSRTTTMGDQFGEREPNAAQVLDVEWVEHDDGSAISARAGGRLRPVPRERRHQPFLCGVGVAQWVDAALGGVVAGVHQRLDELETTGSATERLRSPCQTTPAP